MRWIWRDVRRVPRTPARRQGPPRPAVGVPGPDSATPATSSTATSAASTCFPRDAFEDMADEMMRQVRASEHRLSRQRAFAHSATLRDARQAGPRDARRAAAPVRPPDAELEGRRLREPRPRRGLVRRALRADRRRRAGRARRRPRSDTPLDVPTAPHRRPPTPRKEARGPTTTRDGEAGMTEPFVHRPVMLDEIVEVFATVPAGVILDATLGGGGHTEALLDSRDDLLVLGVDRDSRRPGGGDRPPRALRPPLPRRPRPVRRPPPDHAPPTRSARPSTDETRRRPGTTGLSGALFDLGVSSPQLDRAERGFSFRQSGPLDMRMDHDRAVVGDRRRQRLRRRRAGARHPPLRRRALRHPHRPGHRRRPPDRDHGRAGGHRHRAPSPPPPAAPVAIRRRARSRPSASRSTPSSTHCRPPSTGRSTRPGRAAASPCCRTTRARTASSRTASAPATGACDCPPGLPCVCGAVQTVRLVRGVPKRPSAAERDANPRAASARLRVAERIEPLTGDARTGADDGGDRPRPACRGAPAAGVEPAPRRSARA